MAYSFFFQTYHITTIKSLSVLSNPLIGCQTRSKLFRIAFNTCPSSMLDSDVPNLIAKYLDAKVVIKTYNVMIWTLLIRENLCWIS